MAAVRSEYKTKEEKKPVDTTEQNLKQRIETSIDYFFLDLPTNPEELKTQVAKIKKGFNKELESKDEKGKEELYFQLQKIVTYPPEFFEPLEVLKPNLTMGEVLDHMVKTATRYITKAAEEAKSNLKFLEWNETQVMESLKIKSGIFYSSPFKTDRPGIENNLDPEPYHSPDENIYTVKFYDSRRMFVASITLDFGDPAKLTIPFYTKVKPSPEERAILPGLKLEEAKNVAADLALGRLNLVSDSEWVKKLVINKFYFSLLKEKPEVFFELMSITKEQLKILTSPMVINLIKDKKCDIVTAMQITEPLLKVLDEHYYRNMIYHNQLTIKDLIGMHINERKSKNLISPNICQLHTQKLLTLKQILRMSTAARKLLETEYWFDLFKKRKIKFRSFRHISQEQSKNLKTAMIIYLHSLGKITLKNAKKLKLTEFHRELMSDPAYLGLLRNGEINLEQIQNWTGHYCNMLCYEPLSEALHKKIIALKQTHMFATNPLIRYLVAHKIIKIEELNYIIPTENKMGPAPIIGREHNLDHLKRIATEFLKYAKEGLFVEEDLTILYSFINHIELPPLSIPESKEPIHAPNTLLTNPCMESVFNTNIKDRLFSIYEGNPWTLPNGKKDSLETILATLKKFHVSSFTIWEHIFALRLTCLFRNKPLTLYDEKDSVLIIQKSMRQAVNEFGFHPSKLKEYVARSFLSLLFVDLQDGITYSHAKELNPLYKTLHAEFHAIAKLPPELTYSKVMLDNVMDFAKETLEELRKNHYSLAEGEAKPTKRLASPASLFAPRPLLKEACKNICIIGELIATFNEPSPVLELEKSRKRKTMG